MSPAWPVPSHLSDIYRRLVGRDPLAQSEFAVAVLDPIVCHLRRCHKHHDDATYWTAAIDAVWSVLRNPAVYDPSRGSLRAFLCMAAECDLRNALKREWRHQAKRENCDCVELADDDGNSRQESDAAEGPSFDDADVAAEIADFTPAEHRVFELMRGGAKQTASFAPLLGVEHLPNDDQSRAVKRAKDRIIKRLQRVGRKS
jgi:RNA polymerase sigma-70 factor, ECF subfamily